MKERFLLCPKCDTQPDTAFGRFEPVNDWFISYPKEQLVHMHFGESTPTEEVNIAETTYIYDFLTGVIDANPGAPIFIIFDFTRLDDSEFIPPQSVKLFMKLFLKKELDSAVVYGATSELSKLIKQFISITHTTKVSVVPDYATAVAVYEQWSQDQ